MGFFSQLRDSVRRNSTLFFTVSQLLTLAYGCNLNELIFLTRNMCVIFLETPDSISIRQANHTGPMVEGKEYQLLCEVQNIAPVQYLTLRWYRGQTEVYQHSFSDLTSSSPVQVSSILVITPTKAENDAEYKCVAELDLGPEGPQPPPTLASEPLAVSVYCELCYVCICIKHFIDQHKVEHRCELKRKCNIIGSVNLESHPDLGLNFDLAILA